jgi:TrmH family RNA methyltransferase
MASPKEVTAWADALKSSHPGARLVGSSAKADTLVEDWDFTAPTVLLIGNETDGLSWAYKEMSDGMVRIPIVGSATSLNVACAASAILHEIGRQRRRPRNDPT